MDAYVDTKDQFDKYFEMSTIFTIFFNNWIILDLNSGMGERWCEWGRRKENGRKKGAEKKKGGGDWESGLPPSSVSPSCKWLSRCKWNYDQAKKIQFFIFKFKILQELEVQLFGKYMGMTTAIEVRCER